MGEVELTVPACDDSLLVIRLAASGVAARHGLDIDAVDDVKEAVSEACFYLMNQPVGFSRLKLSFGGGGFAVSIEGAGERLRTAAAAPDREIARMILESMAAVDAFEGDEQGISRIALRSL